MLLCCWFLFLLLLFLMSVLHTANGNGCIYYNAMMADASLLASFIKGAQQGCTGHVALPCSQLIVACFYLFYFFLFRKQKNRFTQDNDNCLVRIREYKTVEWVIQLLLLILKKKCFVPVEILKDVKSDVAFWLGIFHQRTYNLVCFHSAFVILPQHTPTNGFEIKQSRCD